MIPDKHLQTLAPCLMGHNGKPLVRNVVIDNQSLESYLSEEELLDEEDEADMSLMPQNVLHLHVTVTHWPHFMQLSQHSSDHNTTQLPNIFKLHEDNTFPK